MFNHKLCRLNKRNVRPVGSGSDIQRIHVLTTTVLDHIATYHQFENWRQPNTTQFGCDLKHTGTLHIHVHHFISNSSVDK